MDSKILKNIQLNKISHSESLPNTLLLFTKTPEIQSWIFFAQKFFRFQIRQTKQKNALISYPSLCVTYRNCKLARPQFLRLPYFRIKIRWYQSPVSERIVSPCSHGRWLFEITDSSMHIQCIWIFNLFDGKGDSKLKFLLLIFPAARSEFFRKLIVCFFITEVVLTPIKMLNNSERLDITILRLRRKMFSSGFGITR